MIVLIVLVAIAFDTDTFDVFNLTKFTIVLLGAIVITCLWIVESVQRRKFLRPRTGLELALLSLLGATAIGTALSFSKIVALIGFYKSYDGLIAITAFTILALSAAEVFDSRDAIRRALIGASFVGGGFAAFYGVLQYITFVTEGKYKLDWENWGAASFKTSAIFSSFGNPNHLAGYLVMVIPLAITLGATSRRRGVKIFSWIFAAISFLEILQVQTRGAWVAVVAVAIGLVALFLPEIRKNPVPFLVILVISFLMFGIAGLTLRGRGNIFHRVASITDTQDTSGRQRMLLWKAGLDATKERPLFGWGPDTFRVVFLRHQGYEFASRYGPTQVANGPHNVFISWLYSAGLLGLATFLWVLIAFSRRCVRSILETLKIERDPPKRDRSVIVARARNDRLLIGGLLLSVVAFFVSESFNVNQIGISFAFWVITGIGGAYAVLVKEFAGEVETEKERAARKRAAKEARLAKKPPAIQDSKKSKASKPRRDRRQTVKETLQPRTWIAIVICVVAAIPLTYLAITPYRGDRVYRKTVPAIEEAKGYAQELQKNPSAGAEADAFVTSKVEAALALAIQANKTNPSESRYYFDIFEMAQLKSYLLRSGPLQLENVKIAEKALHDALRINPQDQRYYRSLGDLYAYWGGASGPQRRSVDPPDQSRLRDAIHNLYLSRLYNPYDFEAESILMRVGQALSDTAIQSDAGQHGFYLGDAALTVQFAEVLSANGDVPGAIALLETFINRHTNQPAVDKKYADLAGRPAPIVTAPTLPIPTGPPPVEPGVLVPGLPPGLKLPGWS